MSTINVCPACNALHNGVRSRIAFEHTCGKEAGDIPAHKMERNTMTTLGQLQAGDRFRFPTSKVDVWQVTAFMGNMVFYNEIDSTGKKTYLHDKVSHATRQVVFLRSTKEAQND